MLVEVKNLVKRYKDLLAVDNVSFTIEECEIFGLLGPNGAGKTTAINALIGMTRLDSGEIKIFGKNFKDHELDIKRDLGVVPQDLAIFEDLTAHENLCYFGRLYGLKGSLLKERVEEALKLTGLLEKKKEYPRKYSNGMKRRLNIACAIVHHPKLIIMDEPTVGIDPQSRKHILQSVKHLNKMGATIIYISHYMEEVEEICKRVVIMDQGRVIAKGTKDELKALMTSDQRVVIVLSALNYTLVDNIKKLSGVKEACVNGNELTVVSQKNSKNLHRIIDYVTESSEIIALNVEQPSLETVFLTLTGRSLRD
ncbi:ABC transporter ATP-binding protein [Desulfosporosinus youngiae]|uniref:ABC-type multidrug transport system, ATPase component n=1 Tax=Desulfosporosinus youngiae DSM 17734 TaxID=768710 RepID=H5Y2E0_9FIRM|nr:ABC transporter ATP-binding protein [Desulfosporosinus youngiae]EHQ88488.1 ABC-type multidrug transport system, ATPase component [Desulfosporosinus youngiae DSM 17734]